MAGTHRGSRKTHESRRVKYTSIDSKPPGYGRYYFLKNADTRMTNNIQLPESSVKIAQKIRGFSPAKCTLLVVLAPPGPGGPFSCRLDISLDRYVADCETY